MKVKKNKRQVLARAVMLENLEDRRLLSVDSPLDIKNSIATSFPHVNFDTPAQVSYDSTTQIFDIKASAFDIKYSATSGTIFFPQGTLEIQVRLDASGNLLGGVPGDDLILKDNTSQVLLTAEVAPDGQFGYSSGTVDAFTDFILNASGGSLQPTFFSGTPAPKVGVNLALFNIGSQGGLDFSHSFSFSQPLLILKGELGSLPPSQQQPPGIDIEKTTNGPTNSNPIAPDYDNEDAMNGPGVPLLVPGTSVTWTYKVTNIGGLPYTAAQVVVTDDNGTPGNTADDFSPTRDLSTDVGADGILSPGEVWLYKATGTVQTVNGAPGPSSTINTTGSSSTTGAAGNIRNFNSGGISVNVSGFSRDKTTGAWATGYLGSYGGGLGVTDTSESGADPSHTVDNVGRDNYVLFEFNQNVVVDSAFLGYVVTDSDLKVWIGTLPNAFNSHQTLSDAVLASLGFTEVNLTTLNTTRTANLNAGGVSGNVLVIAADPGDTTPDDQFKIANLVVQTPQPGCYENKAVVTVPGGLTDSDLSHYCNPTATPAIDIEKYVKPTTTQSMGGQGLTPGFWKQSQHFQFWTNYTQSQNYNTVFGLTAPHNDDGSLTLLGALQRGGGANNALGRHAVAALLNASNPNINFAFTPAQVIALVQNAYATGNFEAAKNTLAAENEKEGVDLNNPNPNPAPPPTPGYGDDADLPTGPVVPVGSQVTFTFVVTNPGQVPLSNVIVTDNNETPGNAADDFNPTPVLDGGFNVGDDNGDGKLDPGEVWLYTWTKTVTAGQHTNTAKVVGTPVGGGSNVTDSDDANWLGNAPPPTTTITGKKYLDITGNGFTADDTLWNTSLPTVTIKLYKDNGTIGVLDASDTPAGTTTVQANGTYSFSGLAMGQYIVQEVVPTGYLRTAPLFFDYQGVSAPAAQTYTGPTFDNVEKCDTSDYSNVKFYINGSSTPVYDIRGQTHEGDTVKVVFTVPAGHEVHHYAFVAYTAPSASFDANTASQQQIYELAEGDFGPGTYSLTIHAPKCYYQLDFVCGYAIDHLGPANSNIFYTPQGRLISADNGGLHSCTSCPGGSISGFVFLDQNNDGEIDFGEQGIKNVKVTLTNIDTHAVYVDYTDVYGAYSFDNLPFGNYNVEETQPAGYLDGKDTAGNGGGSAFTVTNDKFSNVRIQMCDDDNNWNFGEQLTAGGSVAQGQTATIGFWQNKNGQALLRCLNGGSTHTELGNWLANNFPNLFGVNSGPNNLKGKTNDYIASFFVTQFKVRGVKIEAQVLAVAFAVYVTDTGTAGSAAVQYGFKVDSVGVGNATYNVGTNGAAFGVANGTVLTINQILLRTDALSAGGSGTTQYDLYNGNVTLQNMANNVYDAINNAGDII
jgi:hypothetical protein